jgi:putrescine transport system ATP-binding protein
MSIKAGAVAPHSISAGHDERIQQRAWRAKAGADMMRPLLEVRALTKKFGATAAVDALDLTIDEGEFFALLGPSGCGKTTLMRLIAGLETPDSGCIILDGEDITHAPAHRRSTNMMFQSYALFPHMTVADNIAFGLKRAGLPRAEITARVGELLTSVQMEGYAKRKPAQLSGGQKQRVALARALARRPKLVLLDEPLAALDRRLREETQIELREAQRRSGAGFILVTHDQDEAMCMAHRVAVMREGRIEQIAAPGEIYDAPVNRWVAGFIGDINLIEATVSAREGDRVLLRGLRGMRFETSVERCPQPVGTQAWVALRPERLKIETSAAAEGVFADGQVLDRTDRGGGVVLRVALDAGQVLRVAQPIREGVARDPCSPGDRVSIGCARDAALVLTE